MRSCLTRRRNHESKTIRVPEPKHTSTPNVGGWRVQHGAALLSQRRQGIYILTSRELQGNAFALGTIPLGAIILGKK